VAGAVGPQGPTGPAGPAGATGATGTIDPTQAIQNGTTQQANANFNIAGNGTVAGKITVGQTASNTALALDVAGRARTNGAVFNNNGTNYGRIVVAHNPNGTGDAVTVPWSGADITANPGLHLAWNANAPHLRDVVTCAAGIDPSYSVDETVDPGWPGQYNVTFTPCPGTACITGTYEGWELELYNGTGTQVVGPAASVVHFTLALESGTWRVEHMNGLVGTTAFECH
jgi:hypothetical protein